MRMSADSKNNTSNAERLNVYRILRPEDLVWSVATYTIVPINEDPSHKNRGNIKDLGWELRSEYKSQCRGLGFIIDIDEETIVTPSSWQFPPCEDFHGYHVLPDRIFETNPNDPEHEAIISGILKESIKNRFKEYSDRLGPLWQDYRNFCQMPTSFPNDEDVVYCRGFQVSPLLLANHSWCIKVEVYTKGIDTQSIGDYYLGGNVKRLAEIIRAKRVNRLTRSNLPNDIRVWVTSNGKAEVLELANPNEIISHANLSPETQKQSASLPILCKKFKKPDQLISASEIRLILDTQITQEEHSETIIDPPERIQWYSTLRDFFDGIEAYGVSLNLDKECLSIQEFDNLVIMPPKIVVRISKGNEGVLDIQLGNSLEETIQNRAKQRAHYIRENGYLIQRPINPLLAFPKEYGKESARRLRSDLNWIVENQGLEFKFDEPLLFAKVSEIARKVESGGYDALFAVLPEDEYSENDIDTHEQIKQQLPIPSQCIHYGNTLPVEWVNRRPKELREAKPRLARSIDNYYRLCILNLLVKHHWVPFAPADSFSYNIHVGIDVGGKHNNRVMACIGYGYSDLSHGLLFLPKEIPVNVQKPEPIPTDLLYQGLYSLFEELKNGLSEGGVDVDFSKVLFFRDGEFRGQGDEWNEFEALERLHKELKKQNLIKDSSVWTAVEVSKRAEKLRLIYQDKLTIKNPLVGTCVFPFENKNKAIVCTTGRPYLTQGTASPLLIQILDIYGESKREEVVRDLVWESDMCFTKLDTAMSLPWVLHVADTGALQQSKAYKITGITV